MARDTPIPLDEPAELTGEWWLPGEPDNSAFGRLIYEPDRRLELHAASGSDIFRHDEEIPWVHGITVDGRLVTLRTCFVLNWSLNMPGGIAATVYAQYAFVGMHAASDAELSMLSLRARIVNLSTWLEATGLSVSQIRKRVTAVRYEQLGPRGLGRADDALLTVSFETVGNAEPARAPLRLALEQRAWLEIAPRRPSAYDNLEDILTRVCAFLSFATAVDCAVSELQGKARVPAEEFGTGRLTYRTMPVWVLYERTTTAASQQAAERMLFCFSDVEALNLRPVQRWFRRWTMLGPVVNVYLSGLPTRQLHLEYRFLAFIQALEAYHVRKHPGRMHLKARLDALVSALPAPIRKLVPAQFTKLAKDTRHYFSHWDPDLEANAAKGEQLLYLTRGVKLLFEITLMLELGFRKGDVARAVLEDNQRLVREIQGSFLSL